MKSKPKRITIVDVAKKAGVSISAVSRALNNNPMISLETKKDILKTAKQLGFSLSLHRPGPKPSPSVRKKKVAFLLFLDPHQSGTELPSTFYHLQQSIEAEGRKNGFLTRLHIINPAEELSETISGRDLSGFILRGNRPHPSVEEYLKTKPCCWVMGIPWTPCWGDHVITNHREVGKTAADYLIRKGCRKPVQIRLGCPSQTSALQGDGFASAAGEQGIAVQSLTARSPLPDDPVPYPEVVYVNEIIERFKDEVSSADGLFFDSDHSLATLYPLMVREKIITPGKTVLISCNNQQPYLKGIVPHPATINDHLELVGKMAVTQLIWRITNKEYKPRIYSQISPTLVSLT